jgi:hypothetical protein
MLIETPPAATDVDRASGRLTVTLPERRVRHREAIRRQILDTRERARQAERIEDQVLERLMNRLSGDHFNHTAGHHEARVVVAPHLARRCQLRQILHRSHEVGERLTPRSSEESCPSQPGVCVSRCQIFTSRVAASSATLKSGRYF